MIKQLKCPKCWNMDSHELSSGNRTLYMGKLAIQVRCSKCGAKIYTPEPDEMVLDESES